MKRTASADCRKRTYKSACTPWFMVNHGFTGNLFRGKICARGGYKGGEFLPVPPLFLFLHMTDLIQTAEMTCKPFQTELTSHTKENNLFETVSLAVDRLSRPCPF